MVVLAVRKYKAGYEVREEIHHTNFKAEVFSYGDHEDIAGTDELANFISQPSDVIVKTAYTVTGDYIGDPKSAHYLIVKKGIKPEKISPDMNVCSIGFCEKEQKWYGWSHRAIFGFGIGDKVSEGDCTASSGWTDEYLREHPEEDTSLPTGFTAWDLEDCKKMAIAFAHSVG